MGLKGRLIMGSGYFLTVKLSHLHSIKLRKPLDEYLKKYLLPRFGTTAALIIDYVTEYNAFAVNVKIRNLDGTNTMTYSLNARGNNVTIPAGGTDIISDSPVEIIYISPNAGTGNFSVEAQGIEYKELAA